MRRGAILTIGKTPEPIIYSLEQAKPEYVAFLCTPDSKKILDQVLEKHPIPLSRLKIYEVADDPSRIGNLAKDFYDAYRWLRDEIGLGEGDILTDPTAGRKWMSSGATMIASYLNLNMAYVDVEYVAGKPDPSTMKLIDLGNAYEQTGLLEAEKACHLFNTFYFEAARNVFQTIKTTSSALHDLFQGLALISDALTQWDLFIHYEKDISPHFATGLDHLKRFVKSEDLLSRELQPFIKWVEKMEEVAREFVTLEKPSLLFSIDLLENARRRLAQCRYDDAVARLYRALESLAQFYLSTSYKIDTAKPDYSRLSNDEKQRFEEYKPLPQRITLEEGFFILFLKGHPAGREVVVRFNRSKKRLENRFGQLLEKRNQSILAHGFKPVAKRDAEAMFKRVEGLLEKLLQDEFVKFREKARVPNLPSLYMR